MKGHLSWNYHCPWVQPESLTFTSMHCSHLIVFKLDDNTIARIIWKVINCLQNVNPWQPNNSNGAWELFNGNARNVLSTSSYLRTGWYPVINIKDTAITTASEVPLKHIDTQHGRFHSHAPTQHNPSQRSIMCPRFFADYGVTGGFERILQK